MRVTYTGPSVGVDLLGPDGQMVRVRRGQAIEVPDDYGAALVLQAEWSGGDESETAEMVLLAAIPDLSPPAARALVEAGYTTPAELASVTDDDLREIPGIGDASIATIRAAIPADGGE